MLGRSDSYDCYFFDNIGILERETDIDVVGKYK